MPATDALQRLDQCYQSMPPVAAMGVQVAAYDGARLTLHAPLARHVNDKGCAFGGSLASMMTLAGWGLLWLQLDDARLPADVFVADSQVRYRAPVFGDLQVQAQRAPDSTREAWLAELRRNGRADAQLVASARLGDEAGREARVAARFSARYVAMLRDEAASRSNR